MRPLSVLSVVMVLCLLPPPPPAGGLGPAAREWTVSGPENLADRTIYLEENLTVTAGGRFVLDNVTLRFNSTESAPLVLEVRAGGELVLRNSTLGSNGSGPYLVRALPGSKLTVSGCTVSRAGTCATIPELAGMLVATAQTSIDNTTFRDGAAGLYLSNCSPALRDCLFMVNGAGLLLDGSNASLRRCRFATEGERDILLLNGSHARALDTDVDPALVEVLDAASSLDLLWSLNVTVAWDTGRPAAAAIVSVRPSDGQPSLYQANSSGAVPVIEVLSSTVSSGGLKGHGPFNISAESEGHAAWKVTDIDGAAEVWLTLDGTPPEITIDFPKQGARLNGTPPPASGSARDPYPVEDQTSVELVEGRIDTGDWSIANGTDSWRFGLSGLAEGVHTLEVRARDLSGLFNQSSVTFEVDVSAPSLQVWPPAGHLTGARNITVRIGTDGDSVLFNGTAVAGFIPGRAFELDWPLELEGNNTATVESRDAAGNAAQAELRVVRDTTPPEVWFTSPPEYSVVNSSLAVLTGQSSDPHGISLVEWGTDQANWTRVNGTSEWSFPVLLKEGQNTVFVRATDGAGNAGIGWLRVDLRLPDSTPPELRIIYPEDGQNVELPLMEASVRASDPGGIRTVQFSLDGTDWVNATGTGDWTGQLTLAAGRNTIRARAYDLAGNLNTAAVTVVYVPPLPDILPPALAVLHPPSGLKLTYGKIVVSGRASDPSGIAFVEISADGNNWTRCILTGEDWSGTVSLAPGKNTISVRAQDTAGNRAQDSTAAFFVRPADPTAGQTTLTLILVLVMMALLSAWLVFRAQNRQDRPPGQPDRFGDSEE